MRESAQRAGVEVVQRAVMRVPGTRTRGSRLVHDSKDNYAKNPLQVILCNGFFVQPPCYLPYRRATAWNASLGSQCQSEDGSSGSALTDFVML